MAKKLKLPKRIAGIKIPKPIRKGPVGNFLNSSAGQLVLAEALVLAGAAFAARRVDPQSETGEFLHHPIAGLRRMGRSVAHNGEFSRDAMRESLSRLSHACEEALKAFRAALHDPSPMPGAQTTAVMDAETQTEADAAKKKSSGYRAETPSTPH